MSDSALGAGEDVKQGRTVCASCQFDFVSIGAAAPAPVEAPPPT